MPRGSQLVEERLLREAIHLDQPVDSVSYAIQRQRPVRLPRHRQHASVQVRSGAAIEAHLGVTEGSAERGGGEVQIIEPHGTFELIGASRREEHNRAVRVDTFDWCSAVSRRP